MLQYMVGIKLRYKRCCEKDESAFVSKPLLWLLGGMASAVAGLWILLGFLFLSGTPPQVSSRPKKEFPRQLSQDIPAATSNFLDELVEDSRDEATPQKLQEEFEPPIPTDEPWQIAINAILTNDAEPVELSRRLAAALPGMPLEGQLEAAQHMVNLLGDEEYSTAGSVYFNHAMPEAVRRLVFEDFMNRTNTVKLPLLVRTLKEHGHPLRGQALENLQIYLGRDEGSDWMRWDTAVRESLEKERLEQEALQRASEPLSE